MLTGSGTSLLPMEPMVEGVDARLNKGDVLGGAVERRQPVGEGGDGRGDEGKVGHDLLEAVLELAEVGLGGDAAEAAGAEGDGVGAPAAEHFHPFVPKAVGADDGGDDVRVGLDEGDDGVDADEVRGDEIADVQDMAFELFAAEGEEAEAVGLFGDGDAEGVLGGLDGGEGMGEGADAADAG